MGIMVSKETDENAKLTEKINADLRTRLQNTSEPTGKDFAEDSEYLKDLEKTSRFGWVWFVLIGLAIVSLICIVLI